jgi:hypothetical protein
MSVNWALFGRINQVAEEPGARKLNQEYRSRQQPNVQAIAAGS